MARDADPWITPTERAKFDDAPDCAATRAWLDRLDSASPLISIESFGRTAQGRDLCSSSVKTLRTMTPSTESLKLLF